MSVLFKITYSWEKRSVPQRFDEDDYVDLAAVVLSLEHFVAIYQGQFVVHIHDNDLLFDLRPDLTTIFEELPNVLEALTTKTKVPVKLHFYEQGTDLTFLLERQEDTIFIRFVKGPSVGKQFVNLPETTFSVHADLFLHEWVYFVRAVLKALITLQPELETEESYQQYLKRIIVIQNGSQ